MAKAYDVSCGCGKTIVVSAAQAGQLVRCSCGAEVLVPTLNDLDQLQRHTLRPGRSKYLVANSWGRREAMLLLGGIIFLVGLLLAAWCWASKPKYLPVASMNPIETWLLWQELRLGVLRDPSKTAKAFADATRLNRAATVAALAITAAGAIMLAYAYLAILPTKVKSGHRQ